MNSGTPPVSLYHVGLWEIKIYRDIYGRVNITCSTSGTHCITLAKNPVISHEWEKYGIVNSDVLFVVITIRTWSASSVWKHNRRKNTELHTTAHFLPIISAGFTYRLDRLKPRASKFRGPTAKVYNIFNTVIRLSRLCCLLMLS